MIRKDFAYQIVRKPTPLEHIGTVAMAIAVILFLGYIFANCIISTFHL